MHGIIYWMHGWQSFRIIRAHALHGANSWLADKKLAHGSCDLNTRPLLATSLNPFYKTYYKTGSMDVANSGREFFHDPFYKTGRILLMHGKIYWMHGLAEFPHLYAHMPCTAQTVG